MAIVEIIQAEWQDDFLDLHKHAVLLRHSSVRQAVHMCRRGAPSTGICAPKHTPASPDAAVTRGAVGGSDLERGQGVCCRGVWIWPASKGCQATTENAEMGAKQSWA